LGGTASQKSKKAFSGKAKPYCTEGGKPQRLNATSILCIATIFFDDPSLSSTTAN
jgi:hypothetical protein